MSDGFLLQSTFRILLLWGGVRTAMELRICPVATLKKNFVPESKEVHHLSRSWPFHTSAVLIETVGEKSKFRIRVVQRFKRFPANHIKLYAYGF